jgi:hypothetical protein
MLKRDPLKPDQVSAVIASGKPAKLNAGHSLYLVVKRKARAYWVCQYRDPGNGTVRSKGLGSAAELTMAAARRARDSWMGLDPGERCDRHRRRKAPRAPAGATFGDAHAAYQANHAAEWRPRQRTLVARLFANHTGPFDAMPIAAITAEQIADLLRPFWRGPATGQAARLRGLMAKVFEVAGIEPNPARKALLLLPEKTIEPVHHPAMPASDVPAFMRELAIDTGAVSRCLRFVILCGVRTSEATGATWGEINLGAMYVASCPENCPA